MLTLHYFPGACSMAVHAALEEAGAIYQLRPVALLKGEQYEEAYRRINPRAQVPALEVEGVVLTEVVAILSYLAARFPDAGLLPKDPLEAARTLASMTWISNTLDPAYRRAALPQRFVDDEAARAAVKEAGRKAFWTHLQAVDAMLAAGTWPGAPYSAADVYALVYWGWAGRMRLPLDELPAYGAMAKRLLARPAIHRVLVEEKNPLVQAA